MSLREYQKKRDFKRTPEPPAVVRRSRTKGAFVIQKHAASRLHYDFRLEHDGVLKSWAVPKGPSLDPADKRLAVMVEDHPLAYGGFEGIIPKGQYGAGPVLLWDRGYWIPKGDVDEGLRKGRLEFSLEGRKLHGSWVLVRLRTPTAGERNWLLIKRSDESARPGGKNPVTKKQPESVKSGRSIEEIAAGSRVVRKSARARSRSAASKAAAALSKAGPGDLPTFVEPQLATLVTAAPSGNEWIHEIKYDGYRTLARLEAGRVRWMTRSGLDWSDRFASLSPAVEALPCRSVLLDGEVVVLRPDGTSSFQDLQKALSEGGSDSMHYFAFDLLHVDGLDLRSCAQDERKEVLRVLIGRRRGLLRYSDHVDGQGDAFHRKACRAHLEGIISKRRDLPYRSGRSNQWLKTKCALAQEFVVAGFTRPGGSRVGLGALVLGVRERGRFRHVGRVGTGFDRAALRRFRVLLEPLRIETAPFDAPVSSAASRGVTWVRPRTVVEVSFTSWTADGLLRHPSFRGLREDKPAAHVVREGAVPPLVAQGSRTRSGASAKPKRDSSAVVAGVALTHPDRVLYSEQGLTKLDLARYYEWIAPRILPHLRGRPLSVVRCPRGEGGECFFQKHGHDTFPAGVRSVEVKEKKGGAPYLMVDSTQGLVALVQMGVLELHPWGSRSDRLDQPDRMFFDLDPAPDVRWERVAEAARLIREVLSRLDLQSFLKTTGGKGLHVVVPLARRHGWDDVKAFSRAVAMQISAEEPRLYLATASKAMRKGRIFIDYLRNARGATAVAPFSTRARPGASVSTPVDWKELDGRLRSDTFDVRNLEERLRKQRRDPWQGFSALGQTLSAGAKKALGLG